MIRRKNRHFVRRFAALRDARADSALASRALRIYAFGMQRQIVAIAFVASALIAGAVACSSSSSTGTGTGTGDGGTTGSDSGGGGTDGGTKSDSGSSGDSGGCVPVGTAGNSDGVGKYCATEADCLGNSQATICATLGGDPTQDFCTFSCAPVDGGTDPCGGGGALCDCQGGQCGCVPTSCQ
jgi:hypothetical protein